MGCADHCRKLFRGARLDVEDLFLLEPYQIAYLRERAPQRELAAALHANPAIETFLVSKCPEAAEWLGGVTAGFGPAKDEDELAGFIDSLVWEIADMIVYCKDPELYDTRADPDWNFEEIFRMAPVDGRVIVDAGAGTGRVAFAAAGDARHVFAVEPNQSLRGFIRRKAAKHSLGNVFPLDGFCDAIPLPTGSVDTLFTANAIGWRLESELSEFERVVRPGGRIAHLLFKPDKPEDDPLGSTLASDKWKYRPIDLGDSTLYRCMYTKLSPPNE